MTGGSPAVAATGDAAAPLARAAVLVAAALALVAALAAVRAACFPPSPPVVPGGWFGRERAPRAEAALDRLVRGLLSLQGEDGAFDPYADDPGQPEIRRTVSHALASAALARARELGAGARVPELEAGLGRALDVLKARQQPGGGFGAMPPGVRNPWPAVDAIAGGLHALVVAGRPEDRPVLEAAAAALVRAATYKLRDGWTRALVAIAVERMRSEGLLPLLRGVEGAAGASGESGGDPVVRLVRWDPAAERLDCADYRLAEAICRLVVGRGIGYASGVLGTCRGHPPEWTGETSDLQSWFLQAWLAARTPGGEAWFQEALPAIEEAESSPPAGRIPDGWYADGIAQTACALLCLAEGLGGGR
jgi:hypothetical protein